MKGRPVDELVYESIFPRPKPTDPQTFSAFLQRSLIPEVRQETQAFYGHLDTQEAKYPGLDYTNPTHRIRLCRWHWHYRLFRAFNALGLTHAEIANLTMWEGTKWAKEKFEKEQGVTIRDTTADGFPNGVEPTEPGRVHQSQHQTRNAASSSLDVLENNDEQDDEDGDEDDEDEDDDDDDEDDDKESDEELESVGVELNQRLLAQAARREAGQTSAVLDEEWEEWEQWFKLAIESGELAIITEQMTGQMLRRPSTTISVIPAALIPPSMLTAARAGSWAEIPEFLQPVLRRTLEAEGSAIAPLRAAIQSDSSSRRQLGDGQARLRLPWPRRTYSDLRLPGSDASRTAETRTAREQTSVSARLSS